MSAESHPKPNYGAVFWALLLLTIIEIFAAGWPFPKIAIILILLAFALLKAALVALFYMHLRFEKLLLAVIAVVPFLFCVIFVLVIGADIGHSG